MSTRMPGPRDVGTWRERRQPAPGPALPWPEDDRWSEVVAAACSVAQAREDVSTVYVVLSRRPTYAELWRMREQAAARGVRMAMAGQRDVVIRPRAVVAATPVHPASHGFVSAGTRLFRERAGHAGWLHGLLAMRGAR